MHSFSRTTRHIKCLQDYNKIYQSTKQQHLRNLCVLGIETSCDDTGIALVSLKTNPSTCAITGDVLANVLNSQQKIHSRYGGIIPPRAEDLHRSKIVGVFERCMEAAQITPKQIDAIAVTIMPGLPLSLSVGLRFAKYLCRKFNKPIIPIHHMEAHALQARMEHEELQYPFLCLLISGGHCQLAFVHDALNIVLLGETYDDAPGEAFDKIARRLRLNLIPKYRECNGGQAIEDAAKMSKNINRFEFPLPLAQQRNCNFSFAGIKNNSFRTIRQFEFNERTAPDRLINNYVDFCAGLLRASSRHLMHRTQRALEFCIQNDFFATIPTPTPTPTTAIPTLQTQASSTSTFCRSLVISGGVAQNDYIFNDLAHLASQYQCRVFRPSKNYCSDNGVMIAWNGIERMLLNKNDTLRWDLEELDVVGKIKLGKKSLIDEVEQASIKCKWVQSKQHL